MGNCSCDIKQKKKNPEKYIYGVIKTMCRWGTHVYLWRIHFDIWQNQYNIVKFKNKIKLKKNKYINKLPKGKKKNRPCVIPQSRTALVVQWLRLCVPNAGLPGLIPGQGIRSHMAQLRVCMQQLKRSHVLQLRPSVAK